MIEIGTNLGLVIFGGLALLCMFLIFFLAYKGGTR